MRGDLELLEQLCVVKVLAARPDNQRAAQRIQPDLAGMGGEQQRIVMIERGMGQHRLLRRAHRIKRFADLLQIDHAAAGELAEIEHHGLDPVIARPGPKRADDVARAIFAGRGLAG